MVGPDCLGSSAIVRAVLIYSSHTLYYSDHFAPSYVYPDPFAAMVVLSPVLRSLLYRMELCKLRVDLGLSFSNDLTHGQEICHARQNLRCRGCRAYVVLHTESCQVVLVSV